MQAIKGDERAAVSYLLGKLPDRERRAFEGRYFADTSLFESVCAVEDDLIGSYLRGELPPWTRRRFRKQYLSDPRRRERVEFVARLIEVSRPPSLAPPRARGGFFGLPAAVPTLAMLAVCLVGVFAVFRERRAVDEAAQLRAAHEPAPLLTIMLTPGLLRGGDGPRRWRLPPGAEQVILRLEIPPGGPTGVYHARVMTPEGATVWEGVDLRADSAGVALLAPAAAIAGGDYIVRLEARQGAGFESVEDYAFSVVK